MKRPHQKTRKTYRKKIIRKDSHFYTHPLFFGLLFFIIICGTVFYFKNELVYYYRYYIIKDQRLNRTNSFQETQRISKIIRQNSAKVFGFDLSHYQNIEDIQWDQLGVYNGAIKLDFVIMRATMGVNASDKHFQTYWQSAKENQLIRGAYHFYRPNEDPRLQAENYIKNTKLLTGDLLPIVDVEEIAENQSIEEFNENVSIFIKTINDYYGVSPILYTYSSFYKEYLAKNFSDLPLWIANYNDVVSPLPENLWKIWQFTENGIVDGIATKVDLNIFNGNLQNLERIKLK